MCNIISLVGEIVTNLQKAELLAILALGLVAISCVSPWWGESFEQKSGYYGSTLRYTLTIGLFDSSSVIMGYYGYGAAYSSGFSAYGNNALSTFLTVISLLLILGIMFIIIYLYRLIRGRIEGKDAKATIAFASLGLVFLILAPAVLAIGLSGTFRQVQLDTYGSYQEPGHQDPTNSFFGGYYDTQNKTSLHWGGDTGWAFSIVAFIILLLSLIMLLIETRPKASPPQISQSTTELPSLSYEVPAPQTQTAPQPPQLDIPAPSNHSSFRRSSRPEKSYPPPPGY
jgi:hypothetical protein